MDNKLINDTYFKIVNNLYLKEENFLFSNISLCIALSILSSGLNDESKAEVINFLNGKIDIIKEIIKTSNYKNEGGEIKIASSIWTKYNYMINKEYIKTIKENYLCDSFSIDFSKEKEKVIDWINNSTNNFLRLTTKNYEIRDDINLLLINTIYFNNKWLNKFDKNKSYFDYFNQEKVEFIRHTVDSNYYTNDDFEIFFDYFENDNKVGYLFPKENKEISKFLDIDILKYNFEEVKLDLSLPKFKIVKDFSLKESLKKLGIKGIFNGGLDYINKELYVSDIRQTVGIEFSLEGVEAACVTSISMMRCMLEVKKNVIVKLNRPFICYIYDKNDIILFGGVINNIGGKS